MLPSSKFFVPVFSVLLSAACSQPFDLKMEGELSGRFRQMKKMSECGEGKTSISSQGNIVELSLPAPVAPKFQFCIKQNAFDGIPAPVSLPKIEILFLLDSTGSMQGEINNVQRNLQNLATDLKSITSEIRFGVAKYQDDSVEGGSTTDLVYELLQPMTADIDRIESTVGSIRASGGGDTAEAMYEALYQASTGEGLQNAAGSIMVPASSAQWSFSSDTVRYIVLVSDAPGKKLSYGHSRDEALAALRQGGITVIGMAGSSVSDDFRFFVSQTHAIAKKDIFNIRAGDPLVFTMDASGTILGVRDGTDPTRAIAEAILESVRQTLPYIAEILIEDPESRVIGEAHEFQVPQESSSDSCIEINTRFKELGCGYSRILFSVREKLSDTTLEAHALKLTQKTKGF